MEQIVEIKNRNVNVTVTTHKKDYCRVAMLFYVLDGNATFEYNDKVIHLKESDVLVINRGSNYQYKGSNNLMLASLELMGSTFETVCDGVRVYVGCNSSVENNEQYTQLRNILKKMMINQLFVTENKSKYTYMVFEYYSLYYKLLEIITVYFLLGTTIHNTSPKWKNRDIKRREEIERYIGIHYMEALSLEEIAKEFYISKAYLSKYFVRSFGMPFSIYLKELRLKHAMSDLLYTNKPITQISFDNGFSGSSFFNRAFKEKYQKNPSDIRNEFRENKSKIKTKEDTELINQRLSKLLGDEKGIIVSNISEGKNSFSALKCEPISQCWNFLINIGSAADILKTDIQSHILILSKYINFKYARFWGPLSEELLLDVNSKRDNYNFLRLDQVIDSLLENELKPFIVFEPKLERINEDIDSVIIKAQYETMINDISSWKSIISAMIKHIVQKYGIEEMETWKFELPYGVYYLKDKPSVEGYLQLYDTIADVISEYTNQPLLGGPTLPEVESEVLGEILEGLKKLRYTPDFISMISFAYEAKEQTHRYSYRSADEDYLINDVKKYRKILKEHGFEDIPIYVTEWNQTVVDRSFVNDSCYRGAYIVKNLMQVNPYVSIIGYFSGTDLRTEYFDSKDLLQGGNGLISRDGIFKPAGFAFELMNGLGKYQIGSGSNFMITTDNRNNFYIMIHNIRKLGYYYFKTPEDQIEKERISKICEDEDTFEQELELNDVKNGEYQIRIHKVNAHHGSILDLWKELDYSDNLSRKDIMYLKRICEPQLLFYKIEVINRRLRIRILMEANEFALIEVKRILK